MLEKTTRMNLLYDFYGTLLTEKQRTFLEMYYLDDWSLAEIAEHFEISRQAVHDNIKRASAQLIEYEERLGLVDRFEASRTVAIDLERRIRELPIDLYDQDQLVAMVRQISEIEST